MAIIRVFNWIPNSEEATEFPLKILKFYLVLSIDFSCITLSLTQKQYFHEALLPTSGLHVTQHEINEINQRINYLSVRQAEEKDKKAIMIAYK